MGLFKFIKSIFVSEKKDPQEIQRETRQKTAQEWLPVKEVRNNIVFKKDGSILIFIKMEPVNFALLSENERRTLIRGLQGVYNGIDVDFKEFSLDRPIDLDGYIEKKGIKIQSIKNVKKQNIAKGIQKQAVEMASGGETLERLFYLILESKKNDKVSIDELMNRAREIENNLKSIRLCKDNGDNICSEDELVNLFFNFSNRTQSAFERLDNEPYLPTIVNM